MDDEQISQNNNRKEAAIRANLEFYKDKRFLRAKFEHQLNEHLEKTGSSEKQIVERLQRAIVERISNG